LGPRLFLTPTAPDRGDPSSFPPRAWERTKLQLCSQLESREQVFFCPRDFPLFRRMIPLGPQSQQTHFICALMFRCRCCFCWGFPSAIWIACISCGPPFSSCLTNSPRRPTLTRYSVRRVVPGTGGVDPHRGRDRGPVQPVRRLRHCHGHGHHGQGLSLRPSLPPPPAGERFSGCWGISQQSFLRSPEGSL